MHTSKGTKQLNKPAVWKICTINLLSACLLFTPRAHARRG